MLQICYFLLISAQSNEAWHPSIGVVFLPKFGNRLFSILAKLSETQWPHPNFVATTTKNSVDVATTIMAIATCYVYIYIVFDYQSIYNALKMSVALQRYNFLLEILCKFAANFKFYKQKYF